MGRVIESRQGIHRVAEHLLYNVGKGMLHDIVIVSMYLKVSDIRGQFFTTSLVPHG
jgi:hypothetical protein